MSTTEQSDIPNEAHRGPTPNRLAVYLARRENLALDGPRRCLTACPAARACASAGLWSKPLLTAGRVSTRRTGESGPFAIRACSTRRNRPERTCGVCSTQHSSETGPRSSDRGGPHGPAPVPLWYPPASGMFHAKRIESAPSRQGVLADVSRPGDRRFPTLPLPGGDTAPEGTRTAQPFAHVASASSTPLDSTARHQRPPTVCRVDEAVLRFSAATPKPPATRPVCRAPPRSTGRG